MFLFHADGMHRAVASRTLLVLVLKINDELFGVVDFHWMILGDVQGEWHVTTGVAQSFPES